MALKQVYLIITIDTECDKGEVWKTQFPLKFDGVHLAIKERLQPFFDQVEIKPTYLLSPEVIMDAKSSDYLGSLKDVELGTHLHSEFIEPESKPLAEVTHAIQAELSPELEEAKLRNLTQLFKVTFGYQPESFRSGRFGISNSTLKILDSLGYAADSTVTPFQKHIFDRGITVDFWGSPLFPYHPSEKDYTKKGQLKILEVPTTISIPSLQKMPANLLRFLSQSTKFRRHFESEKVFLRPVKYPVMPLIDMADLIINRWERNTTPVLNVMTHNVEYLPGLSPKAKTMEEADLIFSSLKDFILQLKSRYAVIGIGLSEFAKVRRNE